MSSIVDRYDPNVKAAFPTVTVEEPPTGHPHSEGLTVREIFTLHAMAALITVDGPKMTPAIVADSALAYADAVIARLQNG